MSSIMSQTEKDAKSLEGLFSSCCNKLLCKAVTLLCGHTLCDKCFWETARETTLIDYTSIECKKCGEMNDMKQIKFDRKTDLGNLQCANKYQYFTECEIHISKLKKYFCSDHLEALCTDCVSEHKRQNCHTEPIENKIKEEMKTAGSVFYDDRFKNVAECLCSIEDTEMMLNLFCFKLKKRFHDYKERFARELRISIQDQELIKQVHDDIQRVDHMVSQNIFTHNTLEELLTTTDACGLMISKLKLSEHAKMFVANKSKDFERVLEYDGDPIQLSLTDWSVHRSSSCVEDEETQPCEPSDSVALQTYHYILHDGSSSNQSKRKFWKDGGSLTSAAYRRKQERSWESNSDGILIPNIDSNSATNSNKSTDILSATVRGEDTSYRRINSEVPPVAPEMIYRSQLPHIKEDFTVSGCIGIVILGRFILTNNGEILQKRSFDNSELIKGTELSNMSSLCLVPYSDEISVLQASKFIGVYRADSSKWHFKANITLPYQCICCWKVERLGSWKKYVFVGSYTSCTHRDYIKMITVDHYCEFPKSDKMCECTIKRESILLTSGISPCIRGVSSLDVMRKNQQLLISANGGLVCAKFLGKERVEISWTCPFCTNISHIACDSMHIYVCVPNEKRVAKVSKDGQIITPNILPVEIVPDRIAVKENTVLVGSFFHHDWTCKVYRFTF